MPEEVQWTYPTAGTLGMLPEPARKHTGGGAVDLPQALDLTTHWLGLAALAIFALAYLAVAFEERLGVRKSVPMLLAAGVIWVLVGGAYALAGDPGAAATAARHNLLEFAELFLFLIVAMTYVNTLEDRGVFDALRAWLVGRGLSLRAIFWVTGALAFVLSPFADNLTTALIMGAVVVAAGEGAPGFVTAGCVNVVVAANAGGAFSPFGDVTTLMVWQDGHVPFSGFFALLLPAVVNWLVPAAFLSLTVGRGRPRAVGEQPALAPGALIVAALFAGTIVLTVTLRSVLDLPPAVGMMFGLGALKVYGALTEAWWRPGAGTAATAPASVDELGEVFAEAVTAREPAEHATLVAPPGPASGAPGARARAPAAALPSGPSDGGAAALPSGSDDDSSADDELASGRPIDVFALLERVEWDTLLFFYGVLLCVGGLAALGYLHLTASWLYHDLGATPANVLVGLLSAIIDNVPVMYAVLTMAPDLSQGQWLLVTLTTGVGGSLLSIGSAAGVALMGVARGTYTFNRHLRWAWAIALGYAASIATHLLVNRSLFAP